MKLVSCSECNLPYEIKKTDVVQGKRVCHGCKKSIERNIAASGTVKTWQMSEEERQEYIKKHPIKPTLRQEKKGSGIYGW